MLMMTESTPGLSSLDISSLRYYLRAMLRTALKIDVKGDVYRYIKAQRQNDQTLEQFLAKLKNLTSGLLPEEDTPQLRQAILQTLNHDIKEWILTSHTDWIATLPSPDEIYKAAIMAQENITGLEQRLEGGPVEPRMHHVPEYYTPRPRLQVANGESVIAMIQELPDEDMEVDPWMLGQMHMTTAQEVQDDVEPDETISAEEMKKQQTHVFAFLREASHIVPGSKEELHRDVRKVQELCKQVLASSWPAPQFRRQTMQAMDNVKHHLNMQEQGKCFRCGKLGHYSRNCPEGSGVVATMHPRHAERYAKEYKSPTRRFAPAT